MNGAQRLMASLQKYMNVGNGVRQMQTAYCRLVDSRLQRNCILAYLASFPSLVNFACW